MARRRCLARLRYVAQAEEFAGTRPASLSARPPGDTLRVYRALQHLLHRMMRAVEVLNLYPLQIALEILVFPQQRHLAPRVRIVIDWIAELLGAAYPQMNDAASAAAREPRTLA
jgi:hypothetical protein